MSQTTLPKSCVDTVGCPVSAESLSGWVRSPSSNEEPHSGQRGESWPRRSYPHGMQMGTPLAASSSRSRLRSRDRQNHKQVAPKANGITLLAVSDATGNRVSRWRRPYIIPTVDSKYTSVQPHNRHEPWDVTDKACRMAALRCSLVSNIAISGSTRLSRKYRDLLCDICQMTLTQTNNNA